MTEALISKVADPRAVLTNLSPMSDHSEGMNYLERLPRRLVTLYLPLFIILTVLMFPFYWMALTAIKPDEQLLDLEKFNPFWTWNPTFKHIYKLLFETYYPLWLWNTMLVAVSATILSIIASVLAAYAIVRLRYKGAQWVGGAIFLAYLVPPSILFIPLSSVVFQYGLFDTPFALILTYPTILIPFSTWLLMGYFKTIPFELEECALIDGASRWQILTKIVLPLAIPGLISSFIFCFTLLLERIYLCAHLPVFDAEQDGASCHRQRICRRGYLPMGFANGRRIGRIAAACSFVCVLRRALCVGNDRGRKRIMRSSMWRLLPLERSLGAITEENLSAKLNEKWVSRVKKFVPRNKYDQRHGIDLVGQGAYARSFKRRNRKLPGRRQTSARPNALCARRCNFGSCGPAPTRCASAGRAEMFPCSVE